MNQELPPYISMVDVLERDYNANYEAWKAEREKLYAAQKANFYDECETDIPPITLGQIGAMWYEKNAAPREINVIKFCVMFLLIYFVLFWLCPAMLFHDDANKMNDLGTLDALIDVINPVDENNGVYVLEDGVWREAKENEIYGYMEKSEISD